MPERPCATSARVCVVGDPYQHLKSTLEMVQQRSAHHIIHDFNPTSSASTTVALLQLENLQSKRMSYKVCMMSRIMKGLVDVTCWSTGAQKLQLQGTQVPTQVPHSRTDAYQHHG